MSEFFKTPNSPPTFEEREKEREKTSEEARKVVMSKAAELDKVTTHLSQELVKRGIPTNVMVAAVERKDAGKFRTMWRSQFQAMSDRYHYPVGRKVLGRGWLVSESSYRKRDPHSIVLLESGELMLGSAITGEDKERHIEPYCDNPHGTEAETQSKIDLQNYPVHPLFTSERGYIDTYATIPEIMRATGSPITQGSEESFVANHLERLERDLRENGRKLLGIA